MGFLVVFLTGVMLGNVYKHEINALCEQSVQKAIAILESFRSNK